MPVKIKKAGRRYKVSTPHGVKSKGSTLKNAMAQKRLLNAVEHGWKPGKPSKLVMKKYVMEKRAG